MGDELHLLPMNAGRLLSARRGAGHDLHSLREYQPQDDVRHIDWKATARARHLVVREFASEDERRVHIVLDTRVRGGDGEDASQLAARFERGVANAASLAAHFIDEQAEVRLTLGTEAGAYASGREHLYASLRRLALVTPEAAAPRAAADADAAQPPDLWAAIASHTSADPNFVILLTTAAPGTIPAHVWRTSHVIHL